MVMATLRRNEEPLRAGQLTGNTDRLDLHTCLLRANLAQYALDVVGAEILGAQSFSAGQTGASHFHQLVARQLEYRTIVDAERRITDFEQRICKAVSAERSNDVGESGKRGLVELWRGCSYGFGRELHNGSSLPLIADQYSYKMKLSQYENNVALHNGKHRIFKGYFRCEILRMST
jgi:hypothetical protein